MPTRRVKRVKREKGSRRKQRGGALDPTKSFVTTLAGSGPSAAPFIQNGAGGFAQLTVNSMAIDASGNIYVCDSINNVIRMVTQGGAVSVFAGAYVQAFQKAAGTFTGKGGYADGLGSAAMFTQPMGIAIDKSGNLYVADKGNNRIRMITPAGLVSTLAGSGTAASVAGTGTNASFKGPGSIAVDAAGNVYVGDASYTLKMIAPGGVVTIIAGNGTTTSSDGVGLAAGFRGIVGLAVDASGNVYTAEAGGAASSKVRKVIPSALPVGPSTTWNVTTLAGGAALGSTNGIGSAASFSSPTGVAVDKEANVYVADKGNNLIRIVDPNGGVNTFAGTGVAGSGSFGGDDGPSLSSNFMGPACVALDSYGNVYVGEGNSNLIRKISSIPKYSVPAIIPKVSGGGARYRRKQRGGALDPTKAVVSTFVGNGGSNLFIKNGVGSDAQLSVNSMAIDASGNIYACDATQHVIRMVKPDGAVSIFAGAYAQVFQQAAGTFTGTAGYADGLGSAAMFTQPMGIAIDTSGNLYVADKGTNRIRMITPAGLVSTLAGSGTAASVAGTGTNASFKGPSSIAVDAARNVYVGDASYTLKMIAPGGVVTIIAGNGTTTSSDGVGLAAGFRGIASLAVDASGNVYTAEAGGAASTKIRKVIPSALPVGPSTTWNVTTLAGGAALGSTNGIGSAASFNGPSGVAVDKDANVYVADKLNNLIRIVDPNRGVNTFAGTGVAGSGSFGGDDGPALSSNFTGPACVALDSSGNVYVADSGYNYIRKISAPAVTTTTTTTTLPLTTTTTLPPFVPVKMATAVVSTFAGQLTAGPANGQGVSASFSTPYGLAIDVAGNIYVADYINQLIRKISPSGAVTTLAGSGSNKWADGQGVAASFNCPTGVAVDSAGNVYVADYWSHRVRMVTAGGLVTTLAGSGNPWYVEGQGAAASFNNPAGVAVDSAGNVYVADSGNNAIRMITPTGLVSTLVSTGLNSPRGVIVDASGNIYIINGGGHTINKIPYGGTMFVLAGSGSPTFADGQGTAASFQWPIGGVLDSLGNLYVGDNNNHRIRMVSPSGLVTTLAGSESGSANGSASLATFKNPCGIIMDVAGSLYVADSGNNMIRKIGSFKTYVMASANALTSSNSLVATLAGSGTASYADATGTAATFSSPVGMVADAAGNVYVADTTNNRIRKITSAGVVTTFAGGAVGYADGVGTSAKFSSPADLAIDSFSNLYVADTTNNRIRMITQTGVVSTFAGSGVAGSADATGVAATFNGPQGLTTDASGNVYVADTGSHKIRMITSAGVVTTLAGSGTASFANGVGSAASFNTPKGIIVDAMGNVYVADYTNQIIRMINRSGNVTTFAGSGTAGYADGTGAAAQFSSPSDVALDALGNVYVADTTNNRIRQITQAGIVTTLAGSGTAAWVDGVGKTASFNSPKGLALDALGNVYVADTTNNRIRKIGAQPLYSAPASYQSGNTNSIVATFAGGGATTGLLGYADGTGTSALFAAPFDISIDGSDNMYVADQQNHRIRKITPAGVVTTIAGSTNGYKDGVGTNAKFSSPSGIYVDLSGNIYVGDSGNHCVRKIDTTGNVTTLAGSSTSSATIDGVGTAASFVAPRNITMDSSGNLYVSDMVAHYIRRIDASGNVTKFAGSGNPSNSNGTGTGASFNSPQSVLFDPISTNIYVMDCYNHLIRKITSAGVVSTFAGSGVGKVDGTGTNASFFYPQGGGIDKQGNLYIADMLNYCVRKITPAGVVSTIAGTPGTSGYVNGYGSVAKFSNISSCAVNSAGIIFVADFGSAGNAIRSITSLETPTASLSATSALSGVWAAPNVVTTLAGSGTQAYADGTGTNAKFSAPYGMAVDKSGNVYVADYGNNRIRMVTSSGVVTTLIGYGTGGWGDGTGTGAILYSPSGVVFDSAGTMYIADFSNRRIRKATPTSYVVTTWAGSGTAGFTNSTGTNATFTGLSGIAIDALNNIYGTDSANNAIRMITSTGIVTTFAGGALGSTDGTGVAAKFNNPQGIAIDAAGNLYVADNGNHTIRKITSAGVVTTFAGSAGQAGYVDGVGIAAKFNTPYGVAVDTYGYVYVADYNNYRIRLITSGGVVTTLAGGATGYVDGVGTNALFSYPKGVATDALGNVYVAEQSGLIRKLSPPTLALPTPGYTFPSVTPATQGGGSRKRGKKASQKKRRSRR